MMKLSYRYWYLLAGAVFMLLTNIGYLNLAWHANDDYHYSGANHYAAADKLVYMSMIQQGREGKLFMKNLHTTEPQQGLMLSPHWYVVGQTGRLLGISNNAAYQFYRVVLALAFIGMLYGFLRRLYADRFPLTTPLFILFGGGLGSLYLLFAPGAATLENSIRKFMLLPTDIYVTEGNTLLNFTQSPLFGLSQLMLLASIYLLVRFHTTKHLWWDVLNACMVLLLTVMHPYDLPVLTIVFASWAAWQLWRTGSWLPVGKAAIVIAGGMVALVYNLYVVSAEPVLAEWLKQNLVYSPPIDKYMWGYGLLVPLWLVGMLRVLRTKRDNPWWMLLAFWSAIIWILLYMPTELNRRFINGFHIALACIAAEGWLWIYAQLRKRLVVATATAALVWAGVLSSIVFFLMVNLYFSDSVYTYGYYYTNRDERAVIAFLQQASSRADGLMTSDTKLAFTLTSQLNRPVFRGHDHQTPHLLLKQQQQDWFFAEQTGAALERKKDFLKEANIAFIVVRSGDRAWLPEALFLEEQFSTGTLTVYRVQS